MSASQLLNSSFETIRDALDAGQMKASELAQESLRRFREKNSELNSAISMTEELAVSEAKAADERLARGERSPVLGIPVGIKDAVLIEGTRTTAASRMLENFVAPYDATVITKLKRDGAVFPAKLNLDEFAMGSSNENSFFGPCRNPWHPDYVPGGSSGGSAVAVGARQCPVALGTDTGGSIRQPAAFSGITGIKPTYGRVSRYGVIAFASSMDQVGTMGTDALSCAAALESISGHDIHDATSENVAVPKFYEDTKKFREGNALKGLRVGVPPEFFTEGLDPEVEKNVRESLEVLKSLGATLVDVKLPHNKYGISAYYLLSTSEASSNLARYDGIHYGYRTQGDHLTLADLYARSRSEGFGDEVKLRIFMGTYSLSSGYYDAFFQKAAQVRRLIYNDYKAAFAGCDMIAGPTTPTPAFKFKAKSQDPLAMYLSDVYTVCINLAGLPGLSMNCGFSSQGLPIGLQLIAPWWEETRLLGTAALYQKEKPDTVKLSPVAQTWGGA